MTNLKNKTIISNQQVGTGGMDSKVSAATWALDRGVNVVICNGTQEKAIKTIIGGRKVGTFFTENAAGGPTPVDTLAENGKWFLGKTNCVGHKIEKYILYIVWLYGMQNAYTHHD